MLIDHIQYSHPWWFLNENGQIKRMFVTRNDTTCHFCFWFLILYELLVICYSPAKVFQTSLFAIHFGPLTSDPPSSTQRTGRTGPQHSAGAVSRNSSWSYNGLCESIVSLFLALPKARRGLNNPVSVHWAPAPCRCGVGSNQGPSTWWRCSYSCSALAWGLVSRLHRCHYSPLFINPLRLGGRDPKTIRPAIYFSKK